MSKLPKEIEERFDKEILFPFGDGSRNAVWSISMENELKSFIATILKEERDRIADIVRLQIQYYPTQINGHTFMIPVGWTEKLAKAITNLIKEDEKNNL